MIPIEQTDLRVPGGNCFAACVASILELPIERLPNYNAHNSGSDNWFGLWNEWLKPLNLHFQGWIHNEQSDERIYGGYSICTIGYADQEDSHCCVALDGKIVWNPSPYREQKQHSHIVDWITFQVTDPSLPVMIPPKPERDPCEDCCEQPIRMLVGGGRGSERRENISVCRSCGEFSIFVEEKGHFVRSRFSLHSSAVLIAASQGYRREQTGATMTSVERIWKPLDFGHSRLYHVILTWKTTGKPSNRYRHFTVAGDSPSHAASLIRQLYKESFESPAQLEGEDKLEWWDVRGEALNVLQPKDWTENGIVMLWPARSPIPDLQSMSLEERTALGLKLSRQLLKAEHGEELDCRQCDHFVLLKDAYRCTECKFWFHEDCIWDHFRADSSCIPKFEEGYQCRLKINA